MINKLFQNPLETLENKDLEMIQQMQLQQQPTPPVIIQEELKQNEFIIKVKAEKKQISLKIEENLLNQTDNVCNKVGLSRNEYIEECLKYCNQNIKIIKAN